MSEKFWQFLNFLSGPAKYLIVLFSYVHWYLLPWYQGLEKAAMMRQARMSILDNIVDDGEFLERLTWLSWQHSEHTLNNFSCIIKQSEKIHPTKNFSRDFKLQLNLKYSLLTWSEIRKIRNLLKCTLRLSTNLNFSVHWHDVVSHHDQN